MRLACGFAIALWLSFPAAGIASRQQVQTDPAKAAEQAPAAPASQESAPAKAKSAPPQQPPAETVPVETAPAEVTPAAEKKPPDSETKQNNKDAGTVGGTSAKGLSPGGTSSNGTRKRGHRTASTPEGAPKKIVVREGGAREPMAQIAPGMTPAEATRQRRDAEQWLVSTADKLKLLAERTLDARQQETVGHIRNYMDGARSALKDGDVRRANTLALKAHLLAEDLAKH